MAYVAVDKNGKENIHPNEPVRLTNGLWGVRANYYNSLIDKYQLEEIDTGLELPKGTILKLVGKELTWDDEAVELK